MLASDQSARLSELLAEADIVAAPIAGLAEAPPPGGLALIERSLNGGLRGRPGRARRWSPTASCSAPCGSVGRGRSVGSCPRTSWSGCSRATWSSTSTTASRATPAWCAATAGGEGSEERDFLELHFAEHGPDLGAGRADRARHALRRRREPAAVAARAAASGSAPGRASARPSRDLAKELLELYSARAARTRAAVRRGHAVAAGDGGRVPVRGDAPTSCGRRLEVKADLERGRPMDRLVVGDVGYGKTEVALRAAFKAIQDGMQVAVLVPTTVLAAQHLETFRQRFAAYPVHGPDAVSRFVPHRSSSARRSPGSRRARSTWSSAPTGCCRKDIRVPRPGARRRGRGAALRRRPQGAAQAAADRGPRADAVGDADPADAQPGARRGARHERHRDAARGPAADPDAGRGGVGRPRQGRDPARARPRRPGLLRPQPGRDDRGAGRAAAAAAAAGADRGRPRPDGRRARSSG